MHWLYPMIRDISIGVGGLVLIRLLSQQKRNLEGQVSALVNCQHALLIEATAVNERVDRLFLLLDHDAVFLAANDPGTLEKFERRDAVSSATGSPSGVELRSGNPSQPRSET